jgi:hypothetical protein
MFERPDRRNRNRGHAAGTACRGRDFAPRAAGRDVLPRAAGRAA